MVSEKNDMIYMSNVKNVFIYMCAVQNEVEIVHLVLLAILSTIDLAAEKMTLQT